MATLLSTLPPLAFPHEIDTLRVYSNQPAHLSIEHSGIPFQTTLTPNSADEIVVEQLADYFRESILEPSVISIKINHENVATVQLIPCRWKIPMTAVEFCQQYFLSAAPREKTTHLRAQEVIGWWSNQSENPIITATWLTTSGVQRTTHTPTTTPTIAPNLHTVDCSAANLTPPTTNAQLIAYTLAVGARKMNFRIPPKGYAPRGIVSLTFENLFSQRETFHFFGSHQRHSKPTFSRSRIGGQWRTLRTQEEETYQANTGALSRHEGQRLSDLVATRRAWCENKEVVIVDCDIKEELSPLEPQMATVTWRQSNIARHFDLIQDYAITPPWRGTFDATFDPTFS